MFGSDAGRRFAARMTAATLALAGGCRNACQDVCTQMADYAVECGFTVPDADLDACYARQKNPSGDDAKACRDYGDPTTLRNQWSCEEVSAYFGGGGET